VGNSWNRWATTSFSKETPLHGDDSTNFYGTKAKTLEVSNQKYRVLM
jgi:hypothetical protein